MGGYDHVFVESKVESRLCGNMVPFGYSSLPGSLICIGMGGVSNLAKLGFTGVPHCAQVRRRLAVKKEFLV